MRECTIRTNSPGIINATDAEESKLVEKFGVRRYSAALL
jgi:hypothetical protein